MTTVPAMSHNSVMGNSLRQRCLILLLLLTSSGAQADEVTIDDFAFLSGFWRGTGFGGQSEEIWMPPANGRMFGIFTQYDQGELVFSEFMEITDEGDSFVLRLKHFNPDFSGWEEKTDYVTFRFESVSRNKAVFSGLSYEVSTDNKLTIALRMRQGDGSVTTEEFRFDRVEL